MTTPESESEREERRLREFAFGQRSTLVGMWRTFWAEPMGRGKPRSDGKNWGDSEPDPDAP